MSPGWPGDPGWLDVEPNDANRHPPAPRRVTQAPASTQQTPTGQVRPRRPPGLGPGPGHRRPGRPRPTGGLPGAGGAVGGCWIGPMEVPSTRPAQPEQRGRMRPGLNYLRVSSRRQVDKGFDEDGLSLPAQREACPALCRRAWHQRSLGSTSSGVRAPAPPTGPSSRPCWPASNTPATSRWVVVHKVDRFARNLEDHVTVRALLRRLGVELASVVEPRR